MIPPKQCLARLSQRQDFNQDFTQFQFTLVEPEELERLAGQYVLLQVDEKTTRAYSICSDSKLLKRFDLLVNLSPGGPGTSFLRHLQIGQEVKCVAPLGHFIFQEDPEITDLVFIANGCGIAPIKGLLVDLLVNKKEKRPLTLLWGMRYEDRLFWLDEFQEWQEKYPHFHFLPIISRPSPAWKGESGHVTEHLSALDLPPSSQIYICGHDQMISDVQAIAQEKGISKEKIIIERSGA